MGRSLSVLFVLSTVVLWVLPACRRGESHGAQPPPSQPAATTATTATSAPPVDRAFALALVDNVHAPFATATPPQVVSTGSRIHLLAQGAGTPPATRHIALGPTAHRAGPSTVLPAKTVVASASCGSTVQVVVSDGSGHLAVGIDDRGTITSKVPITLPDRHWTGFVLACAKTGTWILGMTGDAASSALWTAQIRDDGLGPPHEAHWQVYSSSLSATAHGDEIVVLRTHEPQGGTVMRLRNGQVAASVSVSDPFSSSAHMVRLGDKLAVVWGGRQTVRARLYSTSLEPIGPIHELATVDKPRNLGALFAMPGPRSLLAVSYFTSEITDEFVEFPNGRTEPAVQIAQHVVVLDAASGAKTAPVQMTYTGGLGAGGWAGDELLFVVGRSSSMIAHYRIQ